MKTLPRCQTIHRELLAKILSGKHDSRRRLPSETKLVKRFAASRPTVDCALQELQSQGLLDRRAGSGTSLRADKVPQPKLRQLGLLVPGLGRIEIFEVICGELASLARVHDFGMHGGGSTRAKSEANMSIDEADELCVRFIEKQVRGVFFAPFEHTTDHEAANRRITGWL